MPARCVAGWALLDWHARGLTAPFRFRTNRRLAGGLVSPDFLRPARPGWIPVGYIVAFLFFTACRCLDGFSQAEKNDEVRDKGLHSWSASIHWASEKRETSKATTWHNHDDSSQVQCHCPRIFALVCEAGGKPVAGSPCEAQCLNIDPSTFKREWCSRLDGSLVHGHVAADVLSWVDKSATSKANESPELLQHPGEQAGAYFGHVYDGILRLVAPGRYEALFPPTGWCCRICV